MIRSHKYLPFIFAIISIFFLSKCTTKPSNENTDTIKNTIDTAKATISKSEVDKNDLSDVILNTSSGQDRFLNLGDHLKNALNTENLAVSDSASNYKSVTQYFHNSDDEFVDIQYFHDGDIVKGIVLDVFLNSEVDVKNLFDELNLVFLKKYGKAINKDKQNSWHINKTQQITLKDVSVKLAPGLQITVTNIGEELKTE